ncbi:coiled-coil domain-containing protein 55-domain containing protein [Chlamydoabsidia padenii]|nr:coiled-coil domain-containing protein 55-domain containing protein [Chlamydoabsidia padenii]
MKFGLNLTKKKPTGRPTTNRPAATAFAFQDDDDDDDDDDNQSQTPTSLKEQAKKQRQKINQQLQTSASTTLAHQKVKEAQEQALQDDPTIFDYDAVYDDLKAAESQQKLATKTQDTDKKAKYIQNLLEMADIRKKDRLLAEEKKVARERLAEGDEFADKDVFMTESYKKQKAELERIEAEERQREEQAAKKSTMTSFYKQVLDKKEAEHRALMNATKKSQGKPSTTTTSTNTDDHHIVEAKRKGVQLNDNDEVVDKRELLGAGLNVASKPRFGSFGSLASSDARIKERQEEYEAYKRKKVADYDAKRRKGNGGDERERLSKEIEKQMVETKRKAEQEQVEKERALQQAAATRRTTDEAALSARERYLARKKQKTIGGS